MDTASSATLPGFFLRWMVVGAFLFGANGCAVPPEAERKTDAIPSSSQSNAAPAPSASAASPPKPQADRVVLITIDALRADQPWVGYKGIETPNLVRLSQRSTTYTRAYTLANTTGPSLGSLLASRHPTEVKRDDCPLAGLNVDDGLAVALHEAGVWTAAVHGHAYFAGTSAPKAGFELWKMVPQVVGRRAVDGASTGSDVAAIAVELLSQMPKRGFLWAHFLEPHDEYVLHPGFRPSSHPLRGLYDGEVAFVDSLVGSVIDAIDHSTEADRTAIIVAADHGEAFAEHGWNRHGYTLFEEEIRIPLIVYVPGRPTNWVDVPRSTLDISPTIAELLGVPIPSVWAGHSLLSDTPGREAFRPVIIDCPALISAAAQQAVVIGNWKAIYQHKSWTVFDLANDPAERSPVKGADRDTVVSAATSLLQSLKSIPATRCQQQAFKL